MKVLVTANSSFNLANFRFGLMRHLRQSGHEVVGLAPHDEYTAEVQADGFPIEELKLVARGTAPHQELLAIWRANRQIRRIQPDAILSFTIKNNLYCGFSARRLGVPIIPNVTGLGMVFSKGGIPARLARAAYLRAFETAPTVFFQNETDQATFLDHHLIHPDQAVMLPGSGVDLDRFASAPLADRKSGTTFLMIARLLWEKGVAEFVEAARRIRAAQPDVTFRLVGGVEPPGKAAIPEDVLKGWADEGLIEVVGKARDVRAELIAADCIVLPSYYREGTPRSLLEAAATGRAIVTTTMPGCRRTVEDGRNGFLVAPKDVDALTDALRRLAEMSRDDLAAMGTASRDLATARFDEKFVHQAYDAALSRI